MTEAVLSAANENAALALSEIKDQAN